MSRFRTLLHPATFIALLALLVSLGSGAVAAGLITGADIKDNSVTGKDVKESTLAKVKAATNADKVGGTVVKRISYVRNADEGNSTILKIGSFSLVASCSSGSVTVKAKTTSDDAEVVSYVWDASGEEQASGYEDTFVSGSPFEIAVPTSSGHSDAIGSIRYLANNGDQVLVEMWEEDDIAAGDCVLAGYALG